VSAANGNGPVPKPFIWGALSLALLLVIVAAITFARHEGGGAAAGQAVSTAAPGVLYKLPDFSLTNRDGSTVSKADLAGKPWIADFIFTRCRQQCPLLTTQLKALGPELPPGVRRVSFSVDPGYDSPRVLSHYAQAHGIKDDTWLFLTGKRDLVLGLIEKGFKLPVEQQTATSRPSNQPPIVHTTRFVLVDSNGDIRGYYDGLTPDGRSHLLRDLRSLVAAHKPST